MNGQRILRTRQTQIQTLKRTWLSGSTAQIGLSPADDCATVTTTSDPYRTQCQVPSFVMDIPFISSGALSRTHYAIVRKVETATSPQLADQYLLAEVKSIQHRLAQPGLSMVVYSNYLYGLKLIYWNRNYVENTY